MDSRRTILVVDDVEINRIILTEIFQNDYDVIQAENGAEALAILQAGADVSAILLDLMMPVMDGITFMDRLQENRKLSMIPVIVNTEAERSDCELETLKLGAADFITKPYNAEVIRRRVGNIITMYVLQRERLERQLRDARRELTSIVDTVPGGIFTVSFGEQFKVEYFNEGTRKLLGYKNDEPMREVYDDVRMYIQQELRDSVVGEIMDQVKNRAPIHAIFPIDRVNGESIWLDLHGAFFKMRRGIPLYHCVLTDISESVALREELEYRASRDLATGVFNAETFYDIARQFIRTAKSGEYEITYWNIERFKGINDLFGIEVGDRIIRDMASFLQRSFKTYGFVGRLNADNFAALARKGKYSYQEILDGLQQELKKSKIYYEIIVTVGVYEVTDVSVPPAIMCDRAKLASKENADYMRNRISYFKEPLRETYLLEQELISEMEQGLKDQEFFILYQPVFDTISKKPVSAEALVRWKNKDKGTISPGVFIPLFERNGFVTTLDYFVLEEVCKMQAKMMAAGEAVVPISVNMSRNDFYDADVVDRVLNTIQKYHLENWMIKVEITESAYTENLEQLIVSIRALRAAGIEILMDDFGSAYSSLNMLKDVELDILKIDMNFVDQLEQSQRGANIIMSVNSMAKLLDMIVIAEGVETQYQYEFMRGIGCDRIQGYYFSKPLRQEEFIELIRKEAGENIIVPASKSVQQTILIVEDSAVIRTTLRMILEEDYNVIEAKNGQEALHLLLTSKKRIDMIITDIVMPVMDGMKMLKSIKEEMPWFNVPIIVTSDITDVKSVENALLMGAVDYLPKPINHSVLLQKVHNIMNLSDIERLNNELNLLHTMQEKDMVTFTYNRISFQTKVNENSRYLEEFDEFAVFVLFDLDDFKYVNDHYGEEHGNEMLRKFSNLLKNRFGDDAVLGRLGGDEFGLFLRPTITRDLVEPWLNEMLRDIEFQIASDCTELQTVTIGVSVAPDFGSDFTSLVRAAGIAARAGRKEKGAGQISWCKKGMQEEL